MGKKKDEEVKDATEITEETQNKPIKDPILELTDTCKRLQADFENYKKRVENDREQSIEYGMQKVIAAVLPVLDSFEHATKNCKDEKEKHGLSVLTAQLISSLEPFGLRVIEINDNHFNANRHEAILAIEHDKLEKDKIIEEVQKGYMLKNKVFRHSKVIVSKGKNDKKTDKA